MKKILTYLLLISTAVIFSGCARGCESLDRSLETSANYRIVKQSGGEIVAIWDFYGLPNSSESSDGYYFEYHGETVEVSGEVDIYRNADEYADSEWSKIYLGKTLPPYKKR